MAEEEEGQQEFTVDPAKLRKLKNLKYFKDWPEEKIIEWVRLRDNDKTKIPPASPDLVAAIPATATPSEQTTQALAEFNEEEYKKKYNTTLAKFRKEYAVDMNDTNDAESLKALVRYVLQQELADKLIMKEQASASPDHRTLKGLGDFQRSIQMNVNELQDKLGISRKARKEKSVDDIPQYITMLQQKAKAFWERKTIPIRCNKCDIELFRYWENFPDLVERVQIDLICEKCHEKVTYHAGRG
jgi:hypothetical protein